jgi:predicted nucleotidyltransferase
MVERIVRKFRPDKVILFGSHARGRARRGSDVDLLVVMPVKRSHIKTCVALRRAVHDIRVPKDIVVVTPDDVRRFGDTVGTIIRPALREGKVLYAR